MRDIKNRRITIENTQQITKAMKLVATVKFQKAKGKAEQAVPYTKLMYQTMGSILSGSGEGENLYTKKKQKESEDSQVPGKTGVVVITANRGLAGGYNQNIVRLVAAHGFSPNGTLIYAIGRKGKEGLEKKGYFIEADYSDVMNLPIYRDARDIALELLDSYRIGKLSEIYLVYTEFKNMAVYRPTVLKLLPLDVTGQGKTEEMPSSTPLEIPVTEPQGMPPSAPLEAPPVSPQVEPGSQPGIIMNYEPDSETVLNAIMPQYMGSLIYGALLESTASEHGARMAAMDSATANAEDMIDALMLQFNRARQGSITSELTEIIAGANAIGM